MFLFPSEGEGYMFEMLQWQTIDYLSHFARSYHLTVRCQCYSRTKSTGQHSSCRHRDPVVQIPTPLHLVFFSSYVGSSAPILASGRIS
jgi:hypothetical protein